MPRRILVVDDNETNLDLVSRILALEGYDIATAANGVVALQKIDEFKPEMAVLDVMMPDMDGFELCRRMRQIPASADIPVIMLTASFGEEDRLKAREAGADELLGKPFNLDSLRKKIKELLIN